MVWISSPQSESCLGFRAYSSGSREYPRPDLLVGWGIQPALNQNGVRVCALAHATIDGISCLDLRDSGFAPKSSGNAQGLRFVLTGPQVAWSLNSMMHNNACAVKGFNDAQQCMRCERRMLGEACVGKCRMRYTVEILGEAHMGGRCMGEM